jgi:hypothetical protein
MNACPDEQPEREIITFKVVNTPAGWTIAAAGSVPMSTLYLSRDMAVEHARELAAVMRGHGQLARVVVEGEET